MRLAEQKVPWLHTILQGHESLAVDYRVLMTRRLPAHSVRGTHAAEVCDLQLNFDNSSLNQPLNSRGLVPLLEALFSLHKPVHANTKPTNDTHRSNVWTILNFPPNPLSRQQPQKQRSGPTFSRVQLGVPQSRRVVWPTNTPGSQHARSKGMVGAWKTSSA